MLHFIKVNDMVRRILWLNFQSPSCLFIFPFSIIPFYGKMQPNATFSDANKYSRNINYSFICFGIFLVSFTVIPEVVKSF